MFGLLSPRSGAIRFEGQEIAGKRPHDIARLGLSYVPQLDNVFPSLTVEENLEMGSLDRSTTAGQIERMYELFPRLGERRKQAAGTMSGGERQMVAMAKALMPSPTLLLLDEPSAGLAPAFVDAIFEKTEEVNRSGVTVVMVEQNARRALAMSDRGYVLDLGQDRFTGPGPGAARRPEGRRALPRRHRPHRQARQPRPSRPPNAKRPEPEGPGRSHPSTALRAPGGLPDQEPGAATSTSSVGVTSLSSNV